MFAPPHNQYNYLNRRRNWKWINGEVQLWLFRVDKDSSRSRVVMARFSKLSVWKSADDVRLRHGCGMWKSILMLNEDFW